MTCYDKALEIDPRQSLPYSGKARIYRNTGVFLDAVASFHKLSDLHPMNALADFDKAISLNPHSE